MPSWRYYALGDNRLVHGSHELIPSRRTAALLVYLALEGAVSRSKIAGLLWPDTDETIAKNNLNQTLRRLRRAAGDELVTGGSVLNITPDVEVDAALLRSAALAGQADQVAAAPGELLPHFDFDDAPDFAEWLWSTRESLRELRNDAVGTAITTLERQGQLPEALEYAKSLVRDEPLSESAYRHVMRLQYLLGDRAAALQAYERLRAMLLRDFDASPLPESVDLARSIEMAEAPPPMIKSLKSLPLLVLRPPRLVGREAAWSKAAQALRSGKGVFVRGSAGMGKTRLMQGLVADEQHLLIEGRPGDASVPFATLARAIRRFRQGQPEFVPAPWVRAELSRFVPEWGTPPPVASEAEKLRIYDALQAFLLALTRDAPRTILLDDLQFFDAASSAACLFVVTPYWGDPTAPLRSLVAYRTHEIAAEIERPWLESSARDQAVVIDLEALDGTAIEELIENLDLSVGDRADLSQNLLLYTGGKPFFVLEAIKRLIETDSLETTSGATIQPTLKELLDQRLERLSVSALRALQAAAILVGDLNLKILGNLLDVAWTDLQASLDELQEAGFLQGDHFAHDLIFERVISNLPRASAALLHQRAASILEASGGEPARIAEHWVRGGRKELALPHLQAAAARAERNWNLAAALGFFRQAATFADETLQPDTAFDCLVAASHVLGHLERHGEREALARDLLTRAVTSGQEAQAWHVMARTLNLTGRAQEGEVAARRGLECAGEVEDIELEQLLLRDLGASLWFQKRFEEAELTGREGLRLAKQLGDRRKIGTSLLSLAVTLDDLYRFDDSIPYHRRALQAFKQEGDKPLQAMVLNNLMVSLILQGSLEEALHVGQQLLPLIARDEKTTAAGRYLFTLATAEYQLGKYSSSLNTLTRALEMPLELDSEASGRAYTLMADIYLAWGDREAAIEQVTRALRETDLSPRTRGLGLLTLSLCQEDKGSKFTSKLLDAEKEIEKSKDFYARSRLSLTKVFLASPSEGLALGETAYEEALEHHMHGMALAAATRCVQLALAAEDNERVVHYAKEILMLQQSYNVLELSPAEVFETQYLAQRRVQPMKATAHLSRAVDWIEATKRDQVAASHQTSFVTQNPVMRRLLQRRHGP